MAGESGDPDFAGVLLCNCAAHDQLEADVLITPILSLSWVQRLMGGQGVSEPEGLFKYLGHLDFAKERVGRALGRFSKKMVALSATERSAARQWSGVCPTQCVGARVQSAALSPRSKTETAQPECQEQRRSRLGNHAHFKNTRDEHIARLPLQAGT